MTNALESFQQKVRAGDGLERAGEFPAAWQHLAEGSLGMACRKSPALAGCPLWSGERDKPARLLVVRVMRHTGAQIRMARVVAQLARETDLRITLCVEERLVALFARSFPEIDVRGDIERDALLGTTDYWASYERVAQFVWTSSDRIASTFSPLIAASEQVSDLRERYAAMAGGKPIVGVSWHSTNARKDLPAFADWRFFLDGFDAWSVSLQYDPAQSGIDALVSETGHAVHVDAGVDARDDIDSLAAQICATDLVVTVSNTTAHLAGALGQPCIVVLDDAEHLIWPRDCARSFYYPSVVLLRRSSDPWRDVMHHVADQAAATMAMRNRRRSVDCD